MDEKRTNLDSVEVILPDVLRADLDVVFCGTALGRRSAAVRAYYAGRGNLFWPTLYEVGLTPRLLAPDEYEQLPDFGIGLTDVCKTRSGSDAEVGDDAFDVERLVSEISECSPRWLAFNGKEAARAALGEPRPYGRQPDRLGEACLFVLPSTSGRASKYWDVAQWHELAELTRGSR